MNGHTAVVALLLRLRDDVDVNCALTTKGTTPLSAAGAQVLVTCGRSLCNALST